VVTPACNQQSQVIDLEGNATIKLWFQPEQTTSLMFQTLSQVETHCTNPFNYLLEDWALQLPIDYPASLFAQLQPYLGHQIGGLSVDPVAMQLAQEVCLKVHRNTSQFLTELNQQIYQTCKYTTREIGDPLPAGITWTKQAGSCRDLSVLFMEVCRAIGLATRFVSGYQEGDLDDSQELHLHAWVEVYLPGAGWRGFDPTHGLAVSDRHIALVASPFPSYTTPTPGAVTPAGTPWTMDYQLKIWSLD
jgi:transglutaminase-like putative cysteine protease